MRANKIWAAVCKFFKGAGYYSPLLFLIVLLPLSLAGESRTYLVYREGNFPRDQYALSFSPLEFKRFIDTGHKTIEEAGQSFRKTKYTLSTNGRYAIWEVEGKDLDEIKHMESMERQGYIVLLSTYDIVNTTGPYGVRPKEVFSGPLAQMPTDFYRVETSTGGI